MAQHAQDCIVHLSITRMAYTRACGHVHIWVPQVTALCGWYICVWCSSAISAALPTLISCHWICSQPCHSCTADAHTECCCCGCSMYPQVQTSSVVPSVEGELTAQEPQGVTPMRYLGISQSPFRTKGVILSRQKLHPMALWRHQSQTTLHQKHLMLKMNCNLLCKSWYKLHQVGMLGMLGLLWVYRCTVAAMF